jgi:hypothetical protein
MVANGIQSVIYLSLNCPGLTDASRLIRVLQNGKQEVQATTSLHIRLQLLGSSLL